MDSHVTFRIKRNRLRMLLVIAVTALVVAPVAVYASHQFTDVPDSNIFHDDITWMADEGITFGCNPPSNDQFCPKDFVTREQLAATLHRLGAIRNYEIVNGSSAPASSETTQSALAYCPEGKMAIGGGAQMVGPSTTQAVFANVASGDPLGTAWWGAVRETSPTDVDWYVSVYAICADI